MSNFTSHIPHFTFYTSKAQSADLEIMINLMSHLIAGFPDAETSVAIADALVKGGASILEIQLAFSDPSADGPAIQTASTIALEKGFSTKQGLEIVKKIH